MIKRRNNRRFKINRNTDIDFLITHFLTLKRKIRNLEQEKQTLKKENELLKEQVCTDALTGLYNRRALPYILGRQGTLAIGDVDKFKSINDNHGHSIGDKVLEEIGCIIKNCCRHTDMVIRYGGDEFFIFLGDCSQEDAEEKIEEIRALLLAVAEKYGLENLSMSFGITEHSPLDSLEKTVEVADAILRENKKDPGNPRNLNHPSDNVASLKLTKPKSE